MQVLGAFGIPIPLQDGTMPFPNFGNTIIPASSVVDGLSNKTFSCHPRAKDLEFEAMGSTTPLPVKFVSGRIIDDKRPKQSMAHRPIFLPL